MNHTLFVMGELAEKEMSILNLQLNKLQDFLKKEQKANFYLSSLN